MAIIVPSAHIIASVADVTGRAVFVDVLHCRHQLDAEACKLIVVELRDQCLRVFIAKNLVGE